MESEDYYYYFFYQIKPLLAHEGILLDCKESADQVVSSVFHAADQELRGANGHRSVSPLQSRCISCKRSCYSSSSGQCQGRASLQRPIPRTFYRLQKTRLPTTSPLGGPWPRKAVICATKSTLDVSCVIVEDDLVHGSLGLISAKARIQTT